MNKKAILSALLAVFLFTSCGKEKDPYEGITRYSVIGAVPSAAASLLASATVYEYSIDDIRIDSNIILDPSSGTEYLFFPNDDANHLKVKLISDAGTFRWGDTIFRVIPGEKVVIRISLSSHELLYEPMLNDR